MSVHVFNHLAYVILSKQTKIKSERENSTMKFLTPRNRQGNGGIETRSTWYRKRSVSKDLYRKQYLPIS